ncbi:hypothetical protein HPP92_012656 [Vanilla planifolia]|uniref:Uncharacterized protein n=1 Tax=Vanilla planifolia TaxID=51239 RepID=A0A835QT23_VANPL|nr:hypothetical protein HPP92_012656 [Vanilla planifolia]
MRALPVYMSESSPKEMAHACRDSPNLGLRRMAQDLRTAGRTYRFGTTPAERMRWKSDITRGSRPEAKEQRMRDAQEDREGKLMEVKTRKESSERRRLEYMERTKEEEERNE